MTTPDRTRIIMDTLGAVMPITWTVVQGPSSLPDGKLPLYENPDWAKGLDIVIHNECWANGDLPSADGAEHHPPECGAQDVLPLFAAFLPGDDHDSWRELIGMASRRHTRAHTTSCSSGPTAIRSPRACRPS